MHASPLCDASTIAEPGAVRQKHRYGKDVKTVGLNDACMVMRVRLRADLGSNH